MTDWRRTIWFAATLWLAIGLQEAIGWRTVLGARADYPLVATVCISLFISRPKAATYGFLAGLGHGAIVGANLAAYVASRVVAGFATGWLGQSGWKLSRAIVFSSGVIGTLLANLTFTVIAPPNSFITFAGDTIRGAILNGLLTMAHFSLLSKFLTPPRR